MRHGYRLEEFSLRKPGIRHEMVASLAGAYQRPIFYCNAVGGNDQLVFDGNSIAINSSGKLIAQLAGFREDEAIIDSEATATGEFHEGKTPEVLFSALSLGVRDYFRKCGFRSAVVGLSGGIDSAVVAVIAAAALGPENVTGVSMPSQYSSRGSIDDARELVRACSDLGIDYYDLTTDRPLDLALFDLMNSRMRRGRKFARRRAAPRRGSPGGR